MVQRQWFSRSQSAVFSRSKAQPEEGYIPGNGDCRAAPSTARRRRMSLLLCPAATLESESPHEQHRFAFVELVKEGRFHEISHFLKRGDPIERSEWLRSCMPKSHSNAESPLHTLLQYQPPLKVLGLLIQRLRQEFPRGIPPEAQCDAMGRTPLHVACAFGGSVAIVARLYTGATAHYRQPAAVVDLAQYTPLHWACQTAAALTCKKEVDNMVQVIGFLVEAHPESLLWTTAAGKTPEDLLQLHASKQNPIIRNALERAIQRGDEARDNDSTESAELEDDTEVRRDLSWVPTEIIWPPFDDDSSEVSEIGGRRYGTNKATTGTERSKVVACTAPHESGFEILALKELVESIGPPTDSSSCDWCPFDSKPSLNTNSIAFDADFCAVSHSPTTKGKVLVGSSGQITFDTVLESSGTFDYDDVYELMGPMTGNDGLEELWA